MVILLSTPCVRSGGVNSVEVNMNKQDWRESKTRMKNWMMDGNGRHLFGIGGIPRDRDDRDMKTNVWSRGHFLLSKEM